jgi:hypothetical protein
MDASTVFNGIAEVVKVISFIIEHTSRASTPPKYTKEYKDSVLVFKGMDTSVFPGSWCWIEETKEKAQRQSVYNDIYFYLPTKQTKNQSDWVQHVLSKDTIGAQDFVNWFELLDDTTDIYFKNIHLIEEIVETKAHVIKMDKDGIGIPPKITNYIRKNAYIALFNDGQGISDLGVARAAKLGPASLMEKLGDATLQGYLRHEGSGKYAVALNAQTAQGTQLVIYQDHPSTFNKLVLTYNGYLYHCGSRKFIVAKDGVSSKNGTGLILYPEYGSSFNQFELMKGGFLRHRGSGLYVVSSNASKDNQNPLVLWESQPSNFNKLTFIV